jgi:hypothetical protein
VTHDQLVARDQRSDKTLAELLRLVGVARLRTPEDAKLALEPIFDVLRKAEHERRVELHVCAECGTTGVPVLHFYGASKRGLCGVCWRKERETVIARKVVA